MNKEKLRMSEMNNCKFSRIILVGNNSGTREDEIWHCFKRFSGNMVGMCRVIQEEKTITKAFVEEGEVLKFKCSV